ncbi:MAG: hypothetical protein RLZ63_33 [Pseudomonadota bacterium]|jgi:peptidoglycan/LPS O-acetylase OafA/YrhL
MSRAGVFQPDPQQRPSGRFFWVDLLKAVGCVLIVLHHMAFYGPMSDVVAQSWPGTINWLAQYARLAVQVFLVCSGFLTAQAILTLSDMRATTLARLCGRRYLRLAVPLLAALSLTVLLSEMIRPTFQDDSLSAMPNGWQVLAHVLFLQHLLDMEALSAGVWYVAVDFQLYLSALLVAWVGQWFVRQGWGSAMRWQARLVVVLTVLSIVYWTHHYALEDVALFFWGSYGMGWLAWYARTRWSVLHRLGAWLALGVLCVIFDAKGRALTAWAASALLLLMPMPGAGLAQPASLGHRVVRWLSRISYPVFVIHFAVSLLVNAKVSTLWPTSTLMNALGMLMALVFSLGAGEVLHRLTEQGPATWRRWLVWVTAFMASTGLAIRIAG